MITGLIHASYTISDVEKTVAFCSKVLGLEHTRWQISDQPYLASVTGIPGCSLRIGFASADGDETSYEMVEYVQPKGPRAKTGFGIPGSFYMSWEVDNLDTTLERFKQANTPIVGSPAAIDTGLWKDARGVFFLGPDDILTELVEIKHQPEGSGRLLRLHHATLSITSIEKALEIFCKKLAFKLDLIVNSSGDYVSNFVHLADPSMRKAYLSLPNTNFKMELLEYRTAAGPKADMAANNLASGHVCFQVDDIFSTYHELRSAGVEFVGTPTQVTAGVNKGAVATYFKGIDDIRFELFQKPSVT